MEEKWSHNMKVVSKIFGIIFIFFAVLSFLSKFEFKLLQIGSVFDLLPLSLIIKMGFSDREAFDNFVQPYLPIAIGILLAIGIMLIHLSFGPKRRLGSIAPHYGALAFLKNLLFFLSLLFSGFFVTPLILGGIFRFPIALPEALSFMGKGIIPFLIGFGVAVVFLVASLLIRLRQTYESKHMKITYFKDKLLIVYPNHKTYVSNDNLVMVFQDIYNDGYTIVDEFEKKEDNHKRQFRIVFKTKLTKDELKEQFKRRHIAFKRKTSYGLNMPSFYSEVTTFSVSSSTTSWSQDNGVYHRYKKEYETIKTTYSDGSTKTSTRETGTKDLGRYLSTTEYSKTKHTLMKNNEPFLQSNGSKITWDTSSSYTTEKRLGE